MCELIVSSEHRSIEHHYDLPLSPIFFRNNEKQECLRITADGQLHTYYYVGVDWVKQNELAIYVKPKLSLDAQPTDYLKMLFSCLRHPEVANFTKNLYEIKFNKPFIEINKKQDILTPFLVVQFLQILKTIVRKGLKKSYYKVTKNLNARVRGKILVSQTLKQNIIKCERTKTYCQYDEFGVDCVENRILKYTLTFIEKYLTMFPEYSKLAVPVLNYCLPAFQNVDEQVDLHSIKGQFRNSFYKEYDEALRVARLILKRFGYNIKKVEHTQNERVKIPPFWIDMPNLFELYILGLLKDKYQNKIVFQYTSKHNKKPDFLLISENERIIIDAKYKPKWESEYPIDDIRQLSGYAREASILKKMGVELTEIADCLIIYPNQSEEASLELSANLKEKPISGFVKFYKIPIKLPIIK